MNVSIIIPVYNAERYIEKAIYSCLELPEVKEIIVINDGFPDKSKEIVLKLSEKHQKIQLYEHPNCENRGAGASRNLGIEKATQDYIAFLDADDFYLENRFINDKHIFQENPDAVGCYNAIGCYFYSQQAKQTFLSHFSSSITTVSYSSNPNPNNLFRGLLGMIPNYGYFSLDGLTIKRDFLITNKIRFPISSMHEDTVFILKAAFYGKLYPSNIKDPVCLRGVHDENRITANYEQVKLKRFKNRFLMWQTLYVWSQKVNLKSDEHSFIKRQFELFKLLSIHNPKLKNIIDLFIRNPKLIRNMHFKNLLLNKVSCNN